jgi:hypothetical protein
MPRRGYTTQPGVSTPGNRPKPHRALKGRQTEHVYYTIISRPFRANRLTGWFPRAETLG